MTSDFKVPGLKFNKKNMIEYTVKILKTLFNSQRYVVFWGIFNDIRKILNEKRDIKLLCVLVSYFYKNNSNYMLV